MKRLLFLLLTLSAFVLTTCEKSGRHIYLSGQVFDPLTHQGIAGIRLRLYRSKTQHTISEGYDNTKLLDEATTDENGYYLLQHSGSPKGHFVEVEPQEYCAVGWTDDPGIKNRRWITGTHKNMGFQLVPYGYVKENVHNVNCLGPGEDMSYARSNDLVLFEEEWGEEFHGCVSVDGTEYHKVPMGWTRYRIETIYGFDYATLHDSVYVGAGEYVEHTINY